MSKSWQLFGGMSVVLLGISTIAVVCANAGAHVKAEDLPPGPIRERHELMESIGKHAKQIGDAVKRGEPQSVAADAEAISKKAQKISGLFPEGSTHEKSRAKVEIWAHWKDFEQGARNLAADAAALARASKDGGDVKKASGKMFENCKSCHDSFRIPEKD